MEPTLAELKTAAKVLTFLAEISLPMHRYEIDRVRRTVEGMAMVLVDRSVDS